MPMWCSSSDALTSESDVPESHHRIVRIPPGESVVLNSAERAPYLLLIEILHGDLDFDPNKRSNKEILKKMVVQEGVSKDIDPFSSAGNASRRDNIVAEPANGSEVVWGVETADTNDIDSIVASNTISNSISPVSAPEEEEMDLVEQLYGTDASLRGNEIDLSESIVLPPQPKNRELDMATWSQSEATNAFILGSNSSTIDSPISRMAPFAIRRSESTSSNHQQTPSASMTPRLLSLDEYSERMRTAAVMLAQLNANLVREPTTTILPPGSALPPSDSSSVLSSPLRWFSGPSASGSASSIGTLQDSTVSPSLHGSAPTRMKLQASEAAAIRERIMNEMLALEEERVSRMRENTAADGLPRIGLSDGNLKTAEDEGIIRRELSKADPSAIVFSESWSMKKVRASWAVF